MRAAGEESFRQKGRFTIVLSDFQSFLSGSGVVESCPNLACQVHITTFMVNRPYRMCEVCDTRVTPKVQLRYNNLTEVLTGVTRR